MVTLPILKHLFKFTCLPSLFPVWIFKSYRDDLCRLNVDGCVENAKNCQFMIKDQHINLPIC